MKRGGIFVFTGALAVLGSFLVRAVPPIVAARSRAIPARLLQSAPYAAESLGRVVIARDMFRTDRRPPAVAYDPAHGASPLPEGPPKPQLTLTGVVWGDLPEAVIVGLPTTDGPRVVRVGDVVGGLTVRRIARASVVMAGLDTTWMLTVKEPWE